MDAGRRAHLVGVEEALEFFGRLFAFELHGRSQPQDEHRHVGNLKKSEKALLELRAKGMAPE